MNRNREEGAFSADSTPHGIDRSPLKYVVLAGNMREFHQWQQRYQIRGGDAFYVSNSQILRGKSFDPDTVFVIIGTFHSRADADEILNTATSRPGLEGKTPDYQSHFPHPPTP